jgi:hypothetical protein
MSLLLAAYPARLRRRHGTELIMTMAEVAGPAGPSRADRWHLVLDGLRERFRLPPGRPLAVAFAVFGLLIGGAIGAAADSWAGMWTYPTVPAAEPVARQAVGADADADATVQEHLIQQRFFMTSLGTLNPGVDALEAAGRAHERMAAAGWKTTPVVDSGGTDGIHYRRGTFEAEKSGVHLEVTSYYSEDRLIDVTGWSVRPPTYLPLVLGGLLLGLLAGWLAAAALTYRVAGARRPRPGAITAAAALALLVLPAASIYSYLIQYLPAHQGFGLGEFVHRALAYSPAYSLTTGPMNAGQSPWLNKALLIAGLAAAVIAAIVARPGRAEQEPADPQVA